MLTAYLATYAKTTPLRGKKRRSQATMKTAPGGLSEGRFTS